MSDREAFAGLVADLDPRLSAYHIKILQTVADDPDRPWTLDSLAARVLPRMGLSASARSHVFAAVATLEDIGYLQRGGIR